MLLRSRGNHATINGRRAFVGVGHLSMVAGVVLGTATVVGGSGYLIRELHRQASVALSIPGLSEPSPSVAPSPLAAVTSDMLKVSTIALGREPVAIVNGVIITEGGSLVVHTPNGTATLRVVGIRDGIVQLTCAGQTIWANLR
jgi:hypothetical protein